MTELRSDDLRFTASEAAAFPNAAVSRDLAKEDVETLEARTEGWIVGWTGKKGRSLCASILSRLAIRCARGSGRSV